MIGRLALAACAISAAMVWSAHAAEPFVGRWAVTPAVCEGGGGSSAATAALTATDTSLSCFDGTCRIAKMYKAEAVYVQAHCPKEDVAVTLDAQGSRMRVTWGKSKPEELKRCP
jgi:hypothetical protein